MHGTLVGSLSSSVATSSPSSPDQPSPFPLVIEQAPEGGGRFVLLALLIPVLAALMTPFWLVIVHLATDPAARSVLAARPLAGLQLATGLLVLIWIFGWPIAHFALRGVGRRRVTIDRETVHSDVVGRFGAAWTEPLAAYAGVAHRVRTSLSGVRHELVLVHRRPSRSVVLVCAPQIPQEAVAAAAGLFALAEIPSREAASFTPLHGYFRLVEPQPQLATAKT